MDIYLWIWLLACPCGCFCLHCSTTVIRSYRGRLQAFLFAGCQGEAVIMKMAILPLPIPFFGFCVESCALITGLWVMSLLWRLLPFTQRLPILPIHVCLNTHLPQLPSIPTSISPLSPPQPHWCSDLNNSHLTPTPTHDCLEMAWLFVLWMWLFNFPQAEDKEPYNCCNKNELVPKRKEVGMCASMSKRLI